MRSSSVFDSIGYRVVYPALARFDRRRFSAEDASCGVEAEVDVEGAGDNDEAGRLSVMRS